MSKILLRKNWSILESLVKSKSCIFYEKNFSKDSEKGKDDKELEIEEKVKARGGVLHDKQQSVHEESYFHKEELEQLKELKKKVLQKKKPSDEDDKNK